MGYRMACVGAERSRMRLSALIGKSYMALKVELATTAYEGDRRRKVLRGALELLADLYRLEAPRLL